MKKLLLCFCLTAVCLLMVQPAMGANNVYGPVPEPDLLWAVYIDDALCLQWTEVPEAIKYSVELFGVATFEYDDPNELNDPNVIQAKIWVELSYGTSDRTDGGDIGDPNLCILIDDLCDDLVAQVDAELAWLGIDPDALNWVVWGNDNGMEDPNDLYAQVKSLTPGKGKGKGSGGPNNPFKGRQNNRFSEPIWVEPLECILVE